MAWYCQEHYFSIIIVIIISIAYHITLLDFINIQQILPSYTVRILYFNMVLSYGHFPPKL